jgi:arylamine N-acetyltransferase
MVDMVTISGRQYLVDVGFGSNGPHQPIPLEAGTEYPNVGGQTVRLVHEPTAQNLQPSQRLWQYEHRNGADGAWIPTYCFTEVGFIPDDFVIINYYVSTSRDSWFTFYLVCVRILLDPETEEIIGNLTLFNNQLKRRIGSSLRCSLRLLRRTSTWRPSSNILASVWTRANEPVSTILRRKYCEHSGSPDRMNGGRDVPKTQWCR